LDKEENSEDKGHAHDERDQVSSTDTNDELILSAVTGVLFDGITFLQRASKKESKTRLQEDRVSAVSEIHISVLTNENGLNGNGATQTAVGTPVSS